MNNEPVLTGSFERMAADACIIGKQILAATAGEPADIVARDMVDLAAHLLTVPLDKFGDDPVIQCRILARFRDTFEKAVRHEELGPHLLDAIRSLPKANA